MKKSNDLINLVKKIKVKIFFQVLLISLTDIFSYFFLSFLLISLIDSVYHFQYQTKVIIKDLNIFLTVIFFISLLIFRKKLLNTWNIIKHIRNKEKDIKDIFEIGLEFEQEISDFNEKSNINELSVFFKNKFIDFSRSKINEKKILNYFNLFRYKINLILFVLTVILLTLIPGLKYNMEKILLPDKFIPKITGFYPGDIKILIHEDFEIGFRLLEKYPDKPFICFSDNLARTGMETEDELNYKKKISYINNNCFYWIDFGDYKSKKYSIEVEIPAEIEKFIITYNYPGYTNHVAEQKESIIGDISGIYGTKIRVGIVFSKKIKRCAIILGNIRINSELKENVYFFNYDIKSSEKYFIEYEDMNGKINKTINYNINCIKDKKPEIEIISPDGKIEAGPKDKIKIIYYAQDDFGIRKIYFILNYKKRDGSKVIEDFTSTKTLKDFFEYEFNLDDYDFERNEIIRYWFGALDNDLLSGPKYSESEKREIEIKDYSSQHKNINEKTRNIKDKLFEMLADEISLYDKINKAKNELSKSSSNLDIPSLEKNYKIKNELSKSADKIVNDSKDLLKDIENDPMSDLKTYSEFKYFTENIETINKNFNSSIIQNYNESIKDNRYSGDKLENGLKLHDRMISEMEKISLELKNINEYQNMKDIMDNTVDLISEQKKLKEKLTDIKKDMDPEKVAALEETIKKIMKLINEMAEKMAKKKNFPEEFANQDAVKNTDYSKMTDALSSMLEALKKGNVDSALGYAEQMLENLSKMYEDYKNASEETPMSKNQELVKDIEKLSGDIEKVVSEEETIKSRTQVIDESISVLKKKFRENYYQNIINLHNEALKLEMELNSKFGFSDMNYQKMLIVKNELESKNIFYSKLYLEEIVASIIQRNDKLIYYQGDLSMKTTISDTNNKILENEKKVLEFIDDPMHRFEINYDENYKKNINDVMIKQNENINQLQKIKKKADVLKMKSGLFGMKITEQLTNSEESMMFSYENLGNNNPPVAIQSQKNAIDALKNLLDNLNSSKQEIQKGQNATGKPVTSGVKKIKTTGTFGVTFDKIKFPELKDFKKTREERLDILEGMSEKYPEKYKKIIKNYYDKIIE